MWRLIFNKPESGMNATWNIFAADIIQSLEFCNMRGDDIDNVNQICKNSEEQTFQSRSTRDARVIFNSIVKIEGDMIKIYNNVKATDELHFTIKKTISYDQ